MTVFWGLASQVGLKLLALFWAVWSTRSGKIVIAVGVAFAALWFTADFYLDRAYDRGVADSQAQQDAVKRKAIDQARAQGEARTVERRRTVAAEQDALRELAEKQAKVRDDTETADRILLPADDPWLLEKQR